MAMAAPDLSKAELCAWGGDDTKATRIKVTVTRNGKDHVIELEVKWCVANVYDLGFPGPDGVPVLNIQNTTAVRVISCPKEIRQTPGAGKLTDGRGYG